ncbi:MAG: hypothetical protein IJT94_03400 [Oscillibacter sp.]|nr:hypothetical protein [Oscillibacter sp.]
MAGFVKWLQKWRREEGEKWKSLSWRGRAEYLWDYYRLWIVGALCAVILLAWGIALLRDGGRENWFCACFANTYGELGTGSVFWDDFARYAGYDLTEKNLVFQARIYCDPTREDYGNQYYRLLIALLDSGTLDVLVMERERLCALGSAGRLMDLEDSRTRALYDRYSDRLIWCQPQNESYDKAEVAVGIDLTGSRLVGEGCTYPADAVLGVSALSPHPDQAEIFLQFLFEEAAP